MAHCEAHRQGLKVAVAPELLAKSSAPPRLPTGIQVARPGLTIGDFYALIPIDSPLIPKIVENYARFMLRVADVARQHSAESLFVGNETAAFDAPAKS